MFACWKGARILQKTRWECAALTFTEAFRHTHLCMFLHLYLRCTSMSSHLYIFNTIHAQHDNSKVFPGAHPAINLCCTISFCLQESKNVTQFTFSEVIDWGDRVYASATQLREMRSDLKVAESFVGWGCAVQHDHITRLVQRLSFAIVQRHDTLKFTGGNILWRGYWKPNS